jgi:hypothetical protein
MYITMPPFGGGLMQLVAYGAQDIYLTANPSVTFFKTVYQNNMNEVRSFMDQELQTEYSICPESFAYDDAELDDQFSDEDVLNNEEIVLIVII